MSKMDWFIMTDKHHLLRDKEGYLSYQIKRIFLYIKYYYGTFLKKLRIRNISK